MSLLIFERIIEGIFKRRKNELKYNTSSIYSGFKKYIEYAMKKMKELM